MFEELAFDMVIVTRNRPEAFALSIPLSFGQSRQPEKLIIIDSSDNHRVLKSVMERSFQGFVSVCASFILFWSLSKTLWMEHIARAISRALSKMSETY